MGGILHPPAHPAHPSDRAGLPGFHVNVPTGTIRHNDICMKKAVLIAAAREATGNARLGWGGARKWAKKRMRTLRDELRAQGAKV